MTYRMLQPCRRQVRNLVKSIILRKFSSETTKVSTIKTELFEQAPETATPIRDRDVFGTISTSGRRSLQVQLVDKTIPDDPDGYDKMEFDIVPRKNAYYYKYEIPKYARQGPTGLKKALELFQEMKSKDKLEPTMSNFSTLIYGCAKAGYTKRAFDLYEESLRYSNRPTRSMVTCLINACAESPFPEYGLERLKWFLTHIKTEYNWQLNEIQYNSAIKAYGKLGQLEEASELVQEMLDNDVTPSVDTFNMLLIGCASNKESGCAIALRVFKRLKMYGFIPATVTYRLLLRCIRDCGMGSAKLVEDILNELPAMTSFGRRIKYKERAKGKDAKKKFTSNLEWVPLISDMGRSIKAAIREPEGNCDSSLQVVGNHQTKIHSDVKNDGHTSEISPVECLDGELIFPTSDIDHRALPNLLSDDHLDLLTRIKAIDFAKLETRPQRLVLFGGTQGFLDAMVRDNCKPDAKIFSLMLPCLSGTRQDYLDYHELALNMNVERDLSYYDQLIRDICDHGKVKGRLNLALHFVEQMHLDDLRPNISTFEALAGGCGSWPKAKRLMDDVQKCGFVVSSVMIAKFLARAKKSMNFRYLNNLIDFCSDIRFKPYKHQVEDLENLRLKVNDLILKHERSGSDQPLKVGFVDIETREFDRFQSKLGVWLKSAVLRQEDHPWMQFKVDTSSKRDGFRAYKKHLQAMDQLKDESMKRGEALGNLTHRAERLIQAQTQ